jgi:hypothetical protein
MINLQEKIRKGIEFLQTDNNIEVAFSICDTTKAILETHGISVEKCNKYTAMMIKTAQKSASYPQKAIVSDQETIAGRAIKIMHDGVTVATFVTEQLVSKKTLPNGITLVDKYQTQGKGSTSVRKNKEGTPQQTNTNAATAMA